MVIDIQHEIFDLFDPELDLMNDVLGLIENALHFIAHGNLVIENHDTISSRASRVIVGTIAQSQTSLIPTLRPNAARCSGVHARQLITASSGVIVGVCDSATGLRSESVRRPWRTWRSSSELSFDAIST
jgi:hypothetical protein